MNEDILNGYGIFSCLLAADDGTLKDGFEYRGNHQRFHAETILDLQDTAALSLEDNDEFLRFVDISQRALKIEKLIRYTDNRLLFMENIQ